jgi:hypothetical protein
MGTEISSEYNLSVVPQVADSSQDRGLVWWRPCFWEEVLDEQGKNLALKKTDVDSCCNRSANLRTFNWLAL